MSKKREDGREKLNTNIQRQGRKGKQNKMGKESSAVCLTVILLIMLSHKQLKSY